MRLEQPPHQPVASFGDHHPVPAVHPFAAAVLDRFEPGRSVHQFDAGRQLPELLGRQRAEHAHGVLALVAEARMHQGVGEVTRVGEDQQAAGVEVEAPDRQPLAAAQPRKGIEHRRAAGRVVMRDDLAFRLVVQQHLRQLAGARADAPAIDGDHVARMAAIAHRHPGADRRRTAVDRDRTAADQRLHRPARSDAGVGQYLLQLLGRPDGYARRWREVRRHEGWRIAAGDLVEPAVAVARCRAPEAAGRRGATTARRCIVGRVLRRSLRRPERCTRLAPGTAGSGPASRPWPAGAFGLGRPWPAGAFGIGQPRSASACGTSRSAPAGVHLSSLARRRAGRPWPTATTRSTGRCRTEPGPWTGTGHARRTAPAARLLRTAAARAGPRPARSARVA